MQYNCMLVFKKYDRQKPCVKFYDEKSPISMYIYELKLWLYLETDTVLNKLLMLIKYC